MCWPGVQLSVSDAEGIWAEPRQEAGLPEAARRLNIADDELFLNSCVVLDTIGFAHFFVFVLLFPLKCIIFLTHKLSWQWYGQQKTFYPFLVLKSSRKKDLFCRNILLKTMGRERSPSSSSEEERSSKKRSKRSRRTRSRSRDRRRRHGGSDRHHHRRRRYSTSSESSGSEQRAGRKEVERLADLERRKAQEDKKVEEETNRYRRCWSCYQYS